MYDNNWIVLILAALASITTLLRVVFKYRKERKLIKKQEEQARWLKKKKEQGPPRYKSNLNFLLTGPKSCFEDLSFNRAIIASSQFKMGDSVSRTRTFRDLMIHNIDIYANMALLRCEDIASQCLGEGRCKGDTCVMDKKVLVNENLTIFYATLNDFYSYERATPGEYGKIEQEMIAHARKLFDTVDNGISEGALYVIQGPVQNPHRRFCAINYTISILIYIGLNLVSQLHSAHEAMQQSNGTLTKGLFSIKVYPKPDWLKRYEKEKK